MVPLVFFSFLPQMESAFTSPHFRDWSPTSRERLLVPVPLENQPSSSLHLLLGSESAGCAFSPSK